MVFKGFIAHIAEKSGRSSKGKPWTAYSAKIEKEDGTEYDKWLSFGFDKPDVKKGDYVKITTEANDRGYEQVTEVKKLKNAPARVGKGGTQESGGGNGFASTTQKSIHYQNSRNLAATVLGILNDKDALPLSATKGKAGEIKRYEEIMALIDKLTVRFFYDAETLRILEKVADEGATVAAKEDLPDDSDDEEEADADEEMDDDEEEDSDEDDEE
jgi:hypothetical protein